MEALKNEMNEANRKIREELTPKIDGTLGCSVQEIIEAEQERISLSNRIAEIEAELAQPQELLFEEVVENEAFETDKLLEQIADLKLFEAIEPEPENGERIHEYEERRKEHNLIIYMLVQEKLEARDTHYNKIIKAKDADYLDLLGRHQKQITYQSGIEEELETLKNDYQTEVLRVEQLKQSVAYTDEKNERLQESIETLKYDNEQMSETIAKLESQLESKRAETPSASADLQERVANLKAKSKSADDFMKSFYERNNLAMPEVPIPALEVSETEIFQTGASTESGESTSNLDESEDSGERRETEELDEEEAVNDEFVERRAIEYVTRAEHDQAISILTHKLNRIERHVLPPLPEGIVYNVDDIAS